MSLVDNTNEIRMKTEIKDEPNVHHMEMMNDVKDKIKDEPFQNFEIKEEFGIDFITSHEFDKGLIWNNSTILADSISKSISYTENEVEKVVLLEENKSGHKEKENSKTVSEKEIKKRHNSGFRSGNYDFKTVKGEREYFHLPYGWVKEVVYLKNQPAKKGKVREDIYLITPGPKRKKLRNEPDLKKN